MTLHQNPPATMFNLSTLGLVKGAADPARNRDWKRRKATLNTVLRSLPSGRHSTPELTEIFTQAHDELLEATAGAIERGASPGALPFPRVASAMIWSVQRRTYSNGLALTSHTNTAAYHWGEVVPAAFLMLAAATFTGREFAFINDHADRAFALVDAQRRAHFRLGLSGTTIFLSDSDQDNVRRYVKVCEAFVANGIVLSNMPWMVDMVFHERLDADRVSALVSRYGVLDEHRLRALLDGAPPALSDGAL